MQDHPAPLNFAELHAYPGAWQRVTMLALEAPATKQCLRYVSSGITESFPAAAPVQKTSGT